MLDILYAVEADLPQLLADEAGWNSLYIDYHPPLVERLWRPWGEYRVALHRIYPCTPAEALFHPHPWPSAMRVLAGEYEMAVGYGGGEVAPPVAVRLIARGDFCYTMTEPDAWHYVRPVNAPTLSLMVTGQPWSRPSPTPGKPLRPLNSAEAAGLLHDIRPHYPPGADSGLSRTD